MHCCTTLALREKQKSRHSNESACGVCQQCGRARCFHLSCLHTAGNKTAMTSHPCSPTMCVCVRAHTHTHHGSRQHAHTRHLRQRMRTRCRFSASIYEHMCALLPSHERPPHGLSENPQSSISTVAPEYGLCADVKWGRGRHRMGVMAAIGCVRGKKPKQNKKTESFIVFSSKA